MTESVATYDEKIVKAEQRSVSLYESDIEEVERIRSHYDLDSFSQAVRRAIRVTVDVIEQPKARIA